MKKQPLFDTETEQKLIWAMATNPERAFVAFSLVHETDFTDQVNRKNFLIVKKSLMETKAVELSELENFTRYLDCSFETGIFIPKYCKQIREYTKKRSLLTFFEKAIEKIHEKDSDEIIVAAGKTLAKIKKSVEKNSPDVKDISKRVLQKWDETRGKKIIGLDTGIDKLNTVISGYRPKHYWVIGAYTNYGKTTFACYLISKFIQINPSDTVALFSLEMGQEDMYEKIISQYAKEGVYNLRNQTQNYKELIKTFNETSIKLYDDKNTVEDIRFELIALDVQGKLPKLVFVDFIQNISGNGTSEYERISNATRELQSLAMEMNICIVALSQISNEGAKAGSEIIPFKGSGTIAATADLGIQLVRNKEQELSTRASSTDIEIRIVKNRHGPLKKFYLDMNLQNAVLSESVVTEHLSKTTVAKSYAKKNEARLKDDTNINFDY